MSPNDVDRRVSVLSGVVSFGTRVNVCTVPTLEASGQVSSSGSWLPTLSGSPSSEFGPNFGQRTTLLPWSRVARGLTMKPSGKSNRSVFSASLAGGDGGVEQLGSKLGGVPHVNGSSPPGVSAVLVSPSGVFGLLPP